MAVSQRNFLFPVLVVIGLVLFAVFGFGFGDGRPVTDTSDRDVPTRDEEAIDEIARQFVESKDSSEAGAGSSSGGSSARDREAAEAQAEASQRLNLSGKELDDELTRGADGRFDISFDHIKFDIPEDEPYDQEMLTEQIRGLDGQEIKLRGYIRPSFKQRDLKSFIFVRDDKECCFGPGAALFDCVVVKLAKDQTTDYTVRPVAITGKFMLKEYNGPDGNVWAIYRMKNAAVTK